MSEANEHPIGTRVRVTHIEDESDTRDVGKVGIVTGFDGLDLHRMHMVTFEDKHADGFWFGELEVVND